MSVLRDHDELYDYYLSTLSLALEAEQEALWWAKTSSSSSHLLLYFCQTLPHRLKSLTTALIQNPETDVQYVLFPNSPTSTQSPISLFNRLREECVHNQTSLHFLRNERAEQLGLLAITILKSSQASTLELATTTKLSFTAHPPTISIASHRRPSQLALIWPKLLLNTVLIYSSYRLLRHTYDNRFLIKEFVREGKEALEGLVQGWVLEPVKEVWNTVRATGDNYPGREGLVRREGVLADIESLERMALSLAKDVLQYDDAQLEVLKQQVNQGDLTPLMQLYENDIRSPLKSALAGTLVRGILVQVQKAKVDIDQALTGIDKLLKSQELTFAFVGVAPALFILYAVAQGGAALSRYTIAAVGWGAGKVVQGAKAAGGFIASVKHLARLGQVNDELGVRGKDAGANQDGRTTYVALQRVSRKQAWADLRRVERLLIKGRVGDESVVNPVVPAKEGLPSTASAVNDNKDMTPLATGLLILSVERLRVFGEGLQSKVSSSIAASPALDECPSPTSDPRSPTTTPTPLAQFPPHVRTGTLGAGVAVGAAVGAGVGIGFQKLLSAATGRGVIGGRGVGRELNLGLTSDVRLAFLEDVEDLGDLRLSREERLRVVERIWRCLDGCGGGVQRNKGLVYP
ncbi:NCA2-domain-containing protein [Coprinopsis marcescibilis]|uniref:NCA2-domain-containing protein n=1 Tax=Coprinopsis marcescibilis TaxID=230819 RepID=A0A5C3L4V5_COPMA|nr:NCA2-domain-containing protein [Coprinopsis marcescibilis]